MLHSTYTVFHWSVRYDKQVPNEPITCLYWQTMSYHIFPTSQRHDTEGKSRAHTIHSMKLKSFAFAWNLTSISTSIRVNTLFRRRVDPLSTTNNTAGTSYFLFTKRMITALVTWIRKLFLRFIFKISCVRSTLYFAFSAISTQDIYKQTIII